VSRTAHLILVEGIRYEGKIVTSSVNMQTPELLQSYCRLTADGALDASRGCRLASTFRTASMAVRVLLALVIAVLPLAAQSHSTVSFERAPADDAMVATAQPNLAYTRPTQRTMVNNYLFDAYGPYPLVGAAVAAGINQFGNSPPEWGQGAQGFGKRLGSNFAIAAVATTTRYGLSQALNEDAMYYRCDCRGFFPRVNHALLSTFTARHGFDGHRVFSFPALVAPYAGSFTAVYGWYPDRFGAKDAFRTGNYDLLAYAAGNLSLEFLYSGPHSLMSRMHLNNAHGAAVQGPNQ